MACFPIASKGIVMTDFTRCIAAGALLFSATVSTAEAAQFHVLYAFGATGGTTPRGSLHADAAGNLFGTTVFGGDVGCGVVFKIDSSGAQSVLHSFENDQTDSCYPYAGVIEDASGNLYGTTTGTGLDGQDYGTVYKLTPGGSFTVLYWFCSNYYCTDGSDPIGGLVLDKEGNLYGTTGLGGANGYGTIFRYSADGTLTTLYSFRGGNDGGMPLADLISDNKVNLYGTASQGGTYGAGTVFKFTSGGKFKVLHTFKGGRSDGAYPEFGLTRDAAGNLYGTTALGGNQRCYWEDFGYGCAIIFKIDPSGKETILYEFQGRSDGGWPSGLALDAKGNLLGVSRSPSSKHQGAVFALAPDGAFSILHNISYTLDGCEPYDSPILDGSGNLYGTMAYCGSNSYGTVFKVSR